MRLTLATLLLFHGVSVAEDPSPPRDASGVAWTLPFPAAHARAKKEKRLLLIKPIAFGTSADGGW